MIDTFDPPIVIRKRRGTKSLRITVRHDGSIFLTVPWSLSLQRAKQFLMSKQEWIQDACKRALGRPPRLLNQGGHDEYVAHKEAARQCITERVQHFQALYGVLYHRLSIRNQKSRFGSCSAQRNLSFNYRLLFLPPHLRDYVVVHELCHLKELNHSSRFWALLAETIPDYREKKRELQAFSRPIST